ncbi:MAG: hypothetical protein WCG48_03030 [Candidatus Berkelbacteria bacterium]
MADAQNTCRYCGEPYDKAKRGHIVDGTPDRFSEAFCRLQRKRFKEAFESHTALTGPSDEEFVLRRGVIPTNMALAEPSDEENGLRREQ